MYLKEPVWVSEARNTYMEKVGQGYPETDITRGRLANEVLERKVFPVKEGTLDILLVGIGIDGDPIYGSWEPYRISGFLEGKCRDYRMVVVDKDTETLSDVQTRRRVFITNSMYETHNWCKKAWDSFLADTGQDDEVVHELVDGLRLGAYVYAEYGKELKLLDSYLKSGFRMAGIPRSFEEKVESGGVTLVNADIATANLSQFGGFDFVSCPNVLYLLPEDGQRLAIYNVARNTRKGGFVLTNDLGYVGHALLPRQGGWFTEDKQRELGLVIEEILTEKEMSQTLVFKKE